jgi:UDP-N-acetylmuramoyl-L-alanyl-D-glutamate--2,6-diaminopimelate ligase
MEKYMEAKVKLLHMAKVAIVNRDDQSYEKIANGKLQIKKDKMITYGLHKNADVNPEIFPFENILPGEFNQYNCLAAIAVAKQLSIAEPEIKRALKNFDLPKGRMEVVYKKEFTVIIDFAHTPNALVKLLETLRKETKGRIIHVFGSAGERDRGKRKLMGEASSRFSDVIILTAEDPRHENVLSIISDIKAGISSVHETVLSVTDRKKAIREAIQMAGKNDCVVITGKGHEQSMNYGQGEIPWSEHAVVKEALRLRLR